MYRHLLWSATFLLALGPGARGQVQAPIKAADPGPAIEELHITVQDMKTKESRDSVRPGEVLRLEVGDVVRLRMVAIPAGQHRAPRYPATRFGILAGARRISLTKVDPKGGGAVLEAVQVDDPGNPKSTTLVSYELLEELNIRKGLKGGTITIEVVAKPTPQPAPGGGGGGEGGYRPRPRTGITLYEHPNYEGRSETFTSDDAQLRDNYIQQDTASSVRVSGDCEAILYEHGNFQGRSMQVRSDIPDLRGTEVGSDSVSSLEVFCGGRRPPSNRPPGNRPGGGRPGEDRPGDDRPGDDQPGVTLYEHQDFRGRSEHFTHDDAQLADDYIRQDVASSVRVDPGCEVTLYEHPDFRGESTYLDFDNTDLRETAVGSDQVSSLQVRCGRGHGGERGVTLYEHQDFGGRSEFFSSDDPRLNDNYIRQDTASSVRVDSGCRVTLYEHPNYEGKATALQEDSYDLSGTRVGNDSVSSLEVRCERRRF